MSVPLRKYIYGVFRLRISVRSSFVKYVFHSHRCSWSSSRLSTSSCESSAEIDFTESKLIEPAGTSDLNTIIATIPRKGTADDLLQSLVDNEACNSIAISHALILKLLHRFKDDWKSAYAVFRWSQSHMRFSNNPESYEIMVDILGKAHQMDKMNNVLDEMNQNRLVTLDSVAKVMRRMAGARMWDSVIRMFDRLRDFGLEKDTKSMNLLLDILSKERMVEVARKVFIELKNTISPNAYTFNILIHGWCKINKVDEAHWTMEEMKKYGYPPSVITYSTVIKSYCRHKNFNRAYELLDEMEAQGCVPNAITFTSIMSSLANLHEYAEALQAAKRMKSIGCQPDVFFYNCLIHVLGRTVSPNEAVHVFENEMRTNGVRPNVATYNTIIAMFFRHGDEEKALHFLKEMVDSVHYKPDLLTYHAYLKFCFKSGKTESYIAGLLDEIVNKHHLSLDFSTFKLLIHGLCRTDKHEWAFRLFEEMISKGIMPKNQTCYLLLDKMRENGLYDDAVKLEVLMKRMDVPLPKIKGY